MSPVLDQHQLSALVQRGKAGFDDLAAKQRERTTMGTLKLEAHRFLAVPQASPGRARERDQTSSHPALLGSPQAV